MPAQAGGLPDARRTDRRAQEGRTAQGPQGAAVQQALTAPLVVARRHFGTDGVRGVVGETITPELVERLGRAASLWTGAAKVFVGRDTRGSGDASSRRRSRAGSSRRAAIASSAACCRRRPSRCSRSTSGWSSPRRTTRPSTTASSSSTRGAVSFPMRRKSRSRRCSLRRRPRRPGDDRARRDRDRLLPRARARPIRRRSVRATDRRRLRERRVLRASPRRRSSNAAHRFTRSATSPTARTSTSAAAQPTLALLQRTVVELGYDLGIAFDGDGDRMLAVDENGELVDGDQIVAILALDLDVDLVAVTVMANLGLHELMKRARHSRRHDRRRRPLRPRGARARGRAARRRAVGPRDLPARPRHR